MSSSDRANDEYGWIDRYAGDLHRATKELVGIFTLVYGSEPKLRKCR